MQDEASRRDFLWQAAGAGVTTVAMATAAKAQPAFPTGAAAASGNDVRPIACTLRPQQNRWRSVLDLSGLWDFQVDANDEGEAAGWFNGIPAPRMISVPGSWNEQFLDTRDYFGIAWYVTRTTLPAAWRGQRIVLRVGSAVYGAKLWIDGKAIGGHEGGNLPFAFEVTGAVAWDQPMTIALQVENRLLPERVPPTGASNPKRATNVPDVTFDFFPYSGLHRAVTLHTLPPTHLEDITVVTGFDGTTGTVRVRAAASGAYTGPGRAQIGSGPDAASTPLDFRNGTAEATLRIPDVRPWGP